MDISLLRRAKLLLKQSDCDLTLTHYANTSLYSSDVDLPSSYNVAHSGYNIRNVIADEGVTGRGHKVKIETDSASGSKPRLHAFGLAYKHYREDNVDSSLLILSQQGVLLKVSATELLMIDADENLLFAE